ncbi:MAG: branched-chain amino acid aminotransferase [Rickettsiales bacterium]|nr:branched-chain amino acid aminotransferase [Rickettsiales bacterium]
MAGIPMDQRDGWIWYNGEFVEWKEAKCHILNHGLHYGSSVFEGQRAYNGKIFKLEEHTARLRFSANELGFDLPYTNEALNAACLEVLEKNNLNNAYFRPVAWRGSDTLAISAQDTRIHVAIAAWEWPSYFSKEDKMKGLRLSWSKWKRPSPESAPVHAKAAGLYMICTHAKHAAEDAGYNDALMLDYRGYVAECTGANIFFTTKEGEIHTPLADCFLNGITRRTVIQLAKENGYKVVERHIMPDEIDQFVEVFVTGSAAEVTPIGEIDGIHYTPGEITRKLDEAYMTAVGA